MLQITYAQFAAILAVVLIALLVSFLFGRWIRSRHISVERQDAITRSKSVILGEVYEKVLPFLPDFPFAARDMVFLGKWVDYVVFDGLSEWALRKIVFLELKSGGSRLGKNEIMIRDAVDRRKVEYRLERLEGF